VHNSDDLEVLVARFRPAGPPPDLRGRILRGGGDQHVAQAFRPARIRVGAVAEWLPAVAALLLVVLFQWLTGIQQLQLATHFSPEPATPADVLQDFIHD
jgi:hypothetical protein